MDTIKEVKSYLREKFGDGARCPCCGQFVKLYKRKLNSGMTLFLIGLYNLSKHKKGAYFKNQTIMKKMNINTSSLDYSIIKHFGLMEEEKNDLTDKKNSGYWRITQKGIDFVSQKIEVPSHVHLYNNKVLGFSDTKTNVVKSVGSKFNFDELLNESI